MASLIHRFFACARADDLPGVSKVRAVAEEGAQLADTEVLRVGMLRLIRDASILLGDDERTRTAHADLVKCVSDLRGAHIDINRVSIPSADEVRSSIPPWGA